MVDCSYVILIKILLNNHLYYKMSLKLWLQSIGVTLESNLLSGNQKLILGEKHKLKYGISITDSCIDITTTENIIFSLYQLIN